MRMTPQWGRRATHSRWGWWSAHEKLIRTLVTKVGYDGRTGKVTIGFRHAQGKDLCHANTNNQ
jgi:hypothetical protein